ncbi:putative MFS amine transporter [Patellaria atrata CBS 101060]|uniref:MFS amine transporter n=1 Tax=Patellaria atrata CBS 101060 TaxID=1346257 RepID=A0A9P4VS14_9PEZI|nr:putative MFS amine transporter [Patellaria atrata CBS 101060]
MGRLARYTTWFSGDDNIPPIFLKQRSSSLFIVSTVGIAVFTDIFLYAVIVPIVPWALTQRAGVEEDKVQHWVSILIAIYGAALVAFSPICGYLADHTSSRRSPLLLGLVALAGATAMLNVGTTIAIWVVGRLLQGASAAVVWVVGLALLVDTVGQRDIGKAMGFVSIAFTMGIMLGPLLGGIVFDHGGYNAVFAMAYGMIILDIILRVLMIEKKHVKRWEPVVPRSDSVWSSPPNTATTLMPEEKAFYGIDEEKTYGSDNAQQRNIEPMPPGTDSAVDSKSKYPPVITLLASRRLLAALWGILAIGSVMTGFDATLPLFVHENFGWGSTGAGLIFLPIVIPSFLGPLIGWVADIYGARWLSAAGFLLGAPFLILLRLIDHDDMPQKVLLCALLFFIGTAINLVMAPLMAEITYVVEAKEKERPGMFGPKGAYAQAYGLFNMAFAIGCVVGPVWAGMVRDSSGWGTMGWSLAILSGVSAIPTAIWTGGFILRAKRRET